MHHDAHLPPTLVNFMREEVGGSFIEIALLASLIAVVLVIVVLALRKGA